MYLGRMFRIKHTRYNARIIALILFWLAGLLIGSQIPTGSSAAFSYDPMSIPSFWQILFAATLPLWLSLLAINCSVLFLFPVAFAKAISFGFSSVLIVCIYGTAGWLVRLLTMFSGIVSVCTIWILWLSLITDRRQGCLRNFAFAFLVMVAAALLEAYICLPIVQQIISYR